MTEPEDKREFKAGDLVELKSGGPVMTITRQFIVAHGESPEPRWTCVWFHEGVRHSATFLGSILNLRGLAK